MTPDIPAVLFELSSLLMRAAQPGVAEAERSSDLTLSAMLLLVAAEIWDRQAQVLVEENRAVRALLGEAGEDADLRLSALQAENNRLRTALTEAHAAAELGTRRGKARSGPSWWRPPSVASCRCRRFRVPGPLFGPPASRRGR